ncbi:MAG TPA: caspase family protein [Falsiroseomonas sp.]|jgi:peptidoglycan hydrolase-like protein with peptidoglycan-binding domain|nr:caspase family protein [Falsiroseomonas sp.]
MSGRLRLGLVLLLLLAWPAGQALAQRVALVIGAGAYQHVPPLPNATNDATDMAGTLRGLGFAVDLVLDPDRAALEGAVQRFGIAARGAEAALFFYAGHAIEVGGRNWLIPVSAELGSPQQLRFQALEVEAVTEQTQAAARVSLVVLDACRDNPFRQRWPSASRSAAGRGLARVSPATGTLVVFSTAPGAVAADGQGRNSPFTAALLRHLPTPGLEVRPMMAEVRRTVREATAGAQVPWEESSLEGSFYFRPAAAPATVAAPPAAPNPPAAGRTDRDALAWQFVLDSRNPADFEVFLQQFPDSIFAPFARNRLAELRGGATRGATPVPPFSPPPASSPPASPPQVASLPVTPPATAVPDPNRPLALGELQEAQRLLTGMGLDTGGTRGIVGPRTREAMRAFAIAADLPETTGLTASTLLRLRAPPPAAARRAAALGTLARRALFNGDLRDAERLARAGLDLHPEPEAQAVLEQARTRLAAFAPPPPVAAPAAPAAPAALPAPAPAPWPPAPRQAPPASLAVPAPPAGPLPFRCPPPGLRVVFEDGSSRSYLGAAPGDPEVCLARGQYGEERLLFNVHPLPVPNESDLRRALRPIWPAAPGRGNDFIFLIYDSAGLTPTYRARWRVLRREMLEVGDTSRPALVFERLLQGVSGTTRGRWRSEFQGTETLWWDIATGAWLRRDQALVSGLFDDPPFRAQRVEQR